MAITTANPRKSPVLDREGMTVVLTRVVTTLYGCDPVPAEDGGWLFRAICEERRRNDDFFWTERRVHELARELGFWPWSIMQVHTAIRTLTDQDPNDVAPAARGKSPADNEDPEGDLA